MLADRRALGSFPPGALQPPVIRNCAAHLLGSRQHLECRLDALISQARALRAHVLLETLAACFPVRVESAGDVYPAGLDVVDRAQRRRLLGPRPHDRILLRQGQQQRQARKSAQQTVRHVRESSELCITHAPSGSCEG